jgi:hypothetical protein
MTSLPTGLVVIVVGFVAGVALMVVAAVKTVRYHGFGQKTWAPPAVPWFIASMATAVLSLVYGLFFVPW